MPTFSLLLRLLSFIAVMASALVKVLVNLLKIWLPLLLYFVRYCCCNCCFPKCCPAVDVAVVPVAAATAVVAVPAVLLMLQSGIEWARGMLPYAAIAICMYCTSVHTKLSALGICVSVVCVLRLVQSLPAATSSTAATAPTATATAAATRAAAIMSVQSVQTSRLLTVRGNHFFVLHIVVAAAAVVVGVAAALVWLLENRVFFRQHNQKIGNLIIQCMALNLLSFSFQKILWSNNSLYSISYIYIL